MYDTRDYDEVNTIIKKRSPLYLFLGFLFVFGLLLFGYISWRVSPSSKTLPKLRMSGEYTINEGVPLPFDDLEEIDCTGAKEIKITGSLSQVIPAGEEIFFQAHRGRVYVLVNDVKVLDVTSSWSKKWKGFVSKGLLPSDEVTIVLNGLNGIDAADSMEMTLSKIYFGDMFSLLRQQVFFNGLKFLLCILILVMGLAELLTAGILIIIKAKDIRGNVSSGLLMISGAICCLIDYEYINLVILNDSILSLFDTIMQLSLTIFLMLNTTFHMYSRVRWRIGKRLINLWIVLIFLYGLFRYVVKLPLQNMQWLMMLIGVAGVILLAAMTLLIQDYRQFKQKHTPYIILSSIVLTTCILIEILHFLMHYYFLFYAFQIGLVIYTILQYYVLFLQSREREKRAQMAAELEKELVQSQVSIMLSQIRPHFLYNSLTAIQTLCVENPEMAREALGDFAKYLRGNMDSLASKELIPFEKELQHTKRYIQLELIRQGEYLEVEYDIQEMAFYLPTLSLQPIVENAIKHGVGQREDGDKVEIKTWREKQNVYVQVRDNGVGFEVNGEFEPDKNTSHIGLSNVASRVRQMAKGTVSVESKLGVGSCITITLPQEE